MPNDFPWGVLIILGCGLIFTLYVIAYILRIAYLEMQDVETQEQEVEQGDCKQQEAELGECDSKES